MLRIAQATSIILVLANTNGAPAASKLLSSLIASRRMRCVNFLLWSLRLRV